MPPPLDLDEIVAESKRVKPAPDDIDSIIAESKQAAPSFSVDDIVAESKATLPAPVMSPQAGAFKSLFQRKAKTIDPKLIAEATMVPGIHTPAAETSDVVGRLGSSLREKLVLTPAAQLEEMDWMASIIGEDATSAIQNIGRAARMEREMYSPQPPVTSTEKVVDAVAGLGAMLAHFVAARKTIPGKGPLTGPAANVAAMGVVSEVEGDDFRHGAAMGAGLETLHSLPIPLPVKVALESLGFGALTLAEGGDIEEALVYSIFPVAMRSGELAKSFRSRLKEAKNQTETAQIISETMAAVMDQRKNTRVITQKEGQASTSPAAEPVSPTVKEAGKVERVDSGEPAQAVDTPSTPTGEGKPVPFEAMGAMEGGGLEINPGGQPYPRAAREAKELFQSTKEPEPTGRPELANPALEPEARRAVDAIDEIRKQQNIPDKQTFKQWDEAAEVRLKADRKGEEARLMDQFASGQVPDAETTRVQHRIMGETAREAASKPDDLNTWIRFHEIANVYRDVRTEAGRTLAAGRDPLMTPAERMQQKFMEAITRPSIKAGKQLEEIKVKIQEAQRVLDETPQSPQAEQAKQTIQAAREEQRGIFQQEAEVTQRIARSLKDIGVDLNELAGKLDTIAEKGAKGDQRLIEQVVDALVAIERTVGETKNLPWDAVREYWRNSILSGPQTQARNLTGNTVFGTWNTTAQRLIEAAVNLVVRDKDSPRFGEFKPVVKALGPSISLAFRNAVRAAKVENPVLEGDISLVRSLVGKAPIEATSKIEIAERGHAIRGMKGRVIRTPQTILQIADEFAKSLMARMQVVAHAYRSGKAAKLSGEELTKHIDDQVGDLSSKSWEAAMLEAKVDTFQEKPPQIVKSLIQAREIPFIGLPLYFTFPFLTTPYNIAKQGLKKTPAMTPVMLARIARHGVSRMTGGDYRYQRSKVVEDVANNLIAWGATFGVMAWMNAEDGDPRPTITGSAPIDRAKRDQMYRMGIKPYSIRVGDTYHSYQYIEPLATALAFIVDTINGIKSDTSVGGAATAAGSSLVRQFSDKTFLRGVTDLSNMVDTLRSGDSDRTEQTARTWSADFAASWVPNLVRAPIRAGDESIREMRVFSKDAPFTDLVLYKAFPTKELAPPPKVDIWGRDVEKSSPFGKPASDFVFRMLSPMDVSKMDPLMRADLTILNWNNQHSEEQVFKMPPEPFYTRNGVRKKMTDEQYHDFMLKSGKLAARNVQRLRLRAYNPRESDIKAIEKAIEDARVETKARMFRR